MWRQLTFDRNNGGKYTTGHPEVDLMDLLVVKTAALGHMLTFSEAAADPDMVTPNSYAYYFGSFSEAAKQAWQKVGAMARSGVLTENACKLINSYCNKPSEKGVNQMSEIIKSKRGGKKPQYSIAELEAKLKDFYAKNGRLPTQTDVRKYNSGLPAWGTMIKFLGPKSSWLDIVEGKPVVTPPEVSATDPQATVSEAQPTTETSEPKTTEEPDNFIEEPDCDDDIINETIEAAFEENIANEDTSEESPIVKSISHTTHGDLVDIEIKITLPDREKPVLINLTI